MENSKEQDTRDDIPLQTIQNVNLGTIKREELIGLQERFVAHLGASGS